MNTSNQPFAGQWALVSGASGGIGSAIAEALASAGAHVALAGRRRGKLESLARKCGSGAAKVFVTDLTSEREISALARDLLRHGGMLDVLVHSAGIYHAAAFGTTSPAVFDRLWATNVRGPVLLTQRLLPALRRASGQVVFVNSSAGLEARVGVAQYSATHHAMRGIADALRAEVNSDGVRVLSVYPGRTATEMQRRVRRGEGIAYEPELMLQPADVARMIVEALALPRSAEVTDLRIRSMAKP